MDVHQKPRSRRDFIGAASLSAATLFYHDQLAWALGGAASAPRRVHDTGPRILALRLLTAAPLAEMRAFYHDRLGLAVLAHTETELTIAGGKTPITFVRADPDQGRPFYHFAFNIPQNKVMGARAWQLEQSQRKGLEPAPDSPFLRRAQLPK